MHPRRIGFALAVVLGACSTSSNNGGSPRDAGTDSGLVYVGDAAVPCSTHLAPSGADDRAAIQTALGNAQAGDVICFDDGTYQVSGELDLATRNVTLVGTSGDPTKAVLDYTTEIATDRQGMEITVDGFTVDSLTIKNTAGDGIRVEGGTGITFRNLVVSWDPNALHTNPDAGAKVSGAYGVYPVKCTNVLIDNVEVTGARDAAVYVGQSTKAIVKNCKVHGNVAGIEIENSSNCEVYGNHTYDNTAGILVFNLADYTIQGGKQNLVHDNTTEGNNRANFAIPGQTVWGVPVGLGVLIMASSQTELLHNVIQNNNSAGILIVACSTYNNGPCVGDPKFYNWPEAEYIHDNTFAGNGQQPDTGPTGNGGLYPIMHAARPPVTTLEDILWDGAYNTANTPDSLQAPVWRQCIENNGGATFRDFNFPQTLQNQTTDLAPYQCAYQPLPPTTF
jgi:parallel beta-helix repeat protein